MKILVPFCEAQDTSRLIQFSRDIEIYAGFQDLNWSRKFNKGMNRMSKHGSSPDLSSFAKMIETIKEFHKFCIPVFLTLNSISYTQEEIDYISKEYLPALKDVEVDGIIISDEMLIKPLQHFGIMAVGSTMLGIYNQGLAKYYKDKGLTRQIIPRDINMDEIEAIIKANEEVCFEVFLMRNGCRFSDSNCLCTHDVDGGICRRLDRARHYYSNGISQFDDSDWTATDHLYSSFFHLESCGLCAIWRMLKMGVCSGKIVGRADDPIRVYRDLVLCIDNIRIAEKCESEKEYLEHMVLPIHQINYCRSGYSCYYPSVRFGGE